MCEEELYETKKQIETSIYEKICDLKTEAWVTNEPVAFEERYSGKHQYLKTGESWGKLFDCAWLNFQAEIPVKNKKRNMALLIDVNGELLIVDNNGNPLRGLTSKASEFDRNLGEPVKHVYLLPQVSAEKDRIGIWAEAGCNDLFGNVKEESVLKEAALVICHRDIRQLYYDFEFFLDLSNHICRKDDRNYILHKLETSAALFHSRRKNRIKSALALTRDLRQLHIKSKPIEISAIGHSHLDLAWLWPIRETRRKIGRTISTVLELMERYPDYIYGCSQAQMIDWLKEDYPALYNKFRDKVMEGRIEILGAMWVESDMNMPSGESLIRQILYGTQFWRNEFQMTINNLWLPDSFGFSGIIPQIMKKSGILYFSTMKLWWNRTNPFPYHSFRWKGIDGTEALSHILPEGTYNSPALPGSIAKILRKYETQTMPRHALLVFGIGDGGGGPGAEHLERLKRLKGLFQNIKVRQRKVSDFFHLWEQKKQDFPTWEGELYLEKHQGTFTTEGRSKYFNRKMEIQLRELEYYSLLDLLLCGSPYGSEQIESFWKETLLYQFHDILPGTSIKRVYDESWNRYEVLMKESERMIGEHLKSICESLDGKGPFYFNSLSWERSQWIFYNKQWIKVHVPPMGISNVIDEIYRWEEDDFLWSDNSMENKYIRIIFNEDGAIDSLFDKINKREILRKGEEGNRLIIFEDGGDAWDFGKDYRDFPCERPECLYSRTERRGPELVNHQKYRFRDSHMEQEIGLFVDEGKIIFRTKVDWDDPGKTLKTVFPVDLKEGKAICDIDFGFIERPIGNRNSLERAKDEIPAHKWVDISGSAYGAALLNDSKYGYRVKNGDLELTMLRCVPIPGEKKGFTDRGSHHFTYCFYPHKGDCIEASVDRCAYEMNSPLRLVDVTGKGGQKKTVQSYFSTGDSPLLIKSIKKTEKGEGIIIRLVESSGKRVSTILNSSFFATPGNPKASIVNLLEEFENDLLIKKGSIALSAEPFEIITVKIDIN
ncbi:MAG: alpha-mannosidase [Spirochaetaceae bacterium]|nr:alpha-mannosidase [Spirochaetaceae bacterium]